MLIFSGAATALVTPFRDGRVDYAALEKLIDMQLECGISAIVMNGTTGEAATMSEAEKEETVRFAVSRAGGRVPVIAGCSSPSSEYAAKLAKTAATAGASAILTVTPYYNKCTEEGLYLHYKTVADATDLPLVAYNVPSRTGYNIPISAYERLSAIDSLVAVKEASGSVVQAENIISRYQDRFVVYSGCDELIAPLYAVGAKGVISVASNVVPREVVELCKTCAEGALLTAARLQIALYPLVKALFLEVNPIPVKTALAALGLICDEYRLPMCPMSEAGKAILLAELESISQ